MPKYQLAKEEVPSSDPMVKCASGSRRPESRNGSLKEFFAAL